MQQPNFAAPRKQAGFKLFRARQKASQHRVKDDLCNASSHNVRAALTLHFFVFQDGNPDPQGGPSSAASAAGDVDRAPPSGGAGPAMARGLAPFRGQDLPVPWGLDYREFQCEIWGGAAFVAVAGRLEGWIAWEFGMLITGI